MFRIGLLVSTLRKQKQLVLTTTAGLRKPTGFESTGALAIRRAPVSSHRTLPASSTDSVSALYLAC